MRQGTGWVGIIAACDACAKSIDAHNKAIRKGELDALPRCECPGCKARGRWRIPGMLVCGKHKAKIESAHNRIMAGAGGLGLFMPWPNYDRDELVRMAGA